MSKDDNIFPPICNAVVECMKSTVNIVRGESDNSKIKSEDDNMDTLIWSTLGGCVITALNPSIGVPILLLGGASIAVELASTLKKGSVGVLTEDIKIKEDSVIIDEAIDDFDIFKYTTCKNVKGEYPKFCDYNGTYYKYMRPKGVTLVEVNKCIEEIKLALGLKNPVIKLSKDRKSFTISEYKDNLGYSPSYKYFDRAKGELLAMLGVRYDDINDELVPFYVNFSKNYHLLIASTTGGGKSSILRTMIVDMMLHYSPKQLKFYFIDRKMTELVLFEDYKHCVGKCITDMEDIADLLVDLRGELDRRKTIINKCKLQNLNQYNNMYQDKAMNYIVVVIDELLEVLIGKGKIHDTIEESLSVLLSQARAFGMYFILSTQHPSRKLISADIQTNISQRVGLRVATSKDAEIVMNVGGVPLEKITKKGRAFWGLGSEIVELQSYYIGDPKKGNEPQMIKKLLEPLLKDSKEKGVDENSKPKIVLPSKKDSTISRYLNKDKEKGVTDYILDEVAETQDDIEEGGKVKEVSLGEVKPVNLIKTKNIKTVNKITDINKNDSWDYDDYDIFK